MMTSWEEVPPRTEWRKRKMNKEYYEAKAELCRSTAISQLLNGEGDLGIKNLMRMVEALNNAEIAEEKVSND
jgi:hypothetical protein